VIAALAWAIPWMLAAGKAFCAWFPLYHGSSNLTIPQFQPRPRLPVYQIIISPAWILRILILAPLLGILGIGADIIVSSRVSTPRAAEQLGSLVMLLFLALYGVQLAGWVSINRFTFLSGAGITLALDATVLWIGVELFQRETILTRWSG
jgi:hypothetical protein